MTLPRLSLRPSTSAVCGGHGRVASLERYKSIRLQPVSLHILGLRGSKVPVLAGRRRLTCPARAEAVETVPPDLPAAAHLLPNCRRSDALAPHPPARLRAAATSCGCARPERY